MSLDIRSENPNANRGAESLVLEETMHTGGSSSSQVTHR